VKKIKGGGREKGGGGMSKQMVIETALLSFDNLSTASLPPFPPPSIPALTRGLQFLSGRVQERDLAHRVPVFPKERVPFAQAPC